LELGAANSLVTLSKCDVLVHFDTDSDMQIFLQQRRLGLNYQELLLPPPDGIFMTYIMFVSQGTNTGKGEKSGRYSIQILKEAITFHNRENRSPEVEIKLLDCRFEMLPHAIKLFCFLGEIEIYSADELDIIKCAIFRTMGQ
jgi:hypothetical protein